MFGCIAFGSSYIISKFGNHLAGNYFNFILVPMCMSLLVCVLVKCSTTAESRAKI